MFYEKNILFIFRENASQIFEVFLAWHTALKNNYEMFYIYHKTTFLFCIQLNSHPKAKQL